jgi:hypothetical protein
MDDFVEFNIPYDEATLLTTKTFKVVVPEKKTLVLGTKNADTKSKSLYKKNGSIIEYNQTTMEYYRVLRERKMDPITFGELNESTAFKFDYEWDAYTGERLNKDPYGALHFDPDGLIRYFYVNRLRELWVEPVDDLTNNGYFEGYYDIAVGAGEDMYVPSRGHHPERYLFRVPIFDCYITNDHKESFITFGPKLTDDEIKEIDRLALLNGSSYQLKYKKQRPSLFKMKQLYDQAISKTPDIEELQESKSKKILELDVQQLSERANRLAVDRLKDM